MSLGGKNAPETGHLCPLPIPSFAPRLLRLDSGSTGTRDANTGREDMFAKRIRSMEICRCIIIRHKKENHFFPPFPNGAACIGQSVYTDVSEDSLSPEKERGGGEEDPW